MVSGPLADVRVVDLSRWIAGPYCAMSLGDYGADVIRVERTSGEEARNLPPLLSSTDSAYASHYGRNKRGLSLDTRSADGQQILRRLISSADVLIENYRPGTLDKMGLGADELRELNPRLIVVHISGYGQEGPWSRRPLFNAIAEATAGLMSLSNGPAEPLMSGNFSADHAAGQQALAATLAALFERERSGEGQHLDIALFDATVAVLGFPLTAALNDVEVIRPGGNRDATAAPGNLFTAADGRSLYIDAGTDELFAALASAMRAEPDERFRTIAGRDAHVDELEGVIGAWVGGLPADEVSQRLEASGVPHGIVQTLPEVVRHPLMRQRDLVAEFPGRRDGDVLRVPGVPVKFGRTPGGVRLPPPTVGEHTDQILGELGYDADEIARLHETGAV